MAHAVAAHHVYVKAICVCVTQVRERVPTARLEQLLAKLKHTEFQLDATYKALASVRSMEDWRNHAFEALRYSSRVDGSSDALRTLQHRERLAQDMSERAVSTSCRDAEFAEIVSDDDDDECEDDVDMEDSASRGPSSSPASVRPGTISTEQFVRPRGDALSVAQFVISDEWEFAHKVIPCNGLFCMIMAFLIKHLLEFAQIL